MSFEWKTVKKQLCKKSSVIKLFKYNWNLPPTSKKKAIYSSKSWTCNKDRNYPINWTKVQVSNTL